MYVCVSLHKHAKDAMESNQRGRRSSVIPSPSILSRPKLSIGDRIPEHPRDDSNVQGSSLKLQYQELRRNSISSLLGPFTRSKSGTTSSRPSITGVQGQTGSKYRSLKIYQYLAGYTNAATDSNVELSALDETFQKVHSQIQEMSEESRSVRMRLDSLSSAISQLSPAKLSPTDESIKYPTLQLPKTRKNGHQPLERVHSQPPAAVLHNGWGSLTDTPSDSDELTPITPDNVSHESQLDEEPLEQYDDDDNQHSIEKQPMAKHTILIREEDCSREEYLDNDEVFGVVDIADSQ